jgi:broad specificity phosphatase PhoE
MAPCRTTTLIPLFLLFTIILTIYMISHESAAPFHGNPTPEIPNLEKPASHAQLTYTILPNIFTQSLPTTTAPTFNPLNSSLGLIPRSYPSDHDFPPNTQQWPRFIHYLMTLNADSAATISYRLLILSRHGEGFHNVAERFFGTEKWDCYYAGLDGSEKVKWKDAELTDLGVSQAKEVGATWERLVREEGVVLPEAWYVSPLRRAVRTCDGTWRGLIESQATGKEFTPRVKEGLREGIGIHTCDRRSTRSSIAQAFPDVDFEEAFPEDDSLWVPDRREPGAAQDIRVRGALDDIFLRDRRLFISITSHGGTISSILRVVGHRWFFVPTGGVLPVVVKVEVRRGERGKEEEIPWEWKPECAGGEPGEREVREMLGRFDESLQGRL